MNWTGKVSLPPDNAMIKMRGFGSDWVPFYSEEGRLIMDLHMITRVPYIIRWEN